MSGSAARRCHHGEDDEGERTDGQEAVAERADDLLLRVGRREGQHEAAERDGDEQGADEVGATQHGPPARAP